MRCPFCGEDETKVIDSRLAGEGDQIRRRRACQACNERFTTYEKAELLLPRIIKSDGVREPYDEQKLRRGMMHALEKRPVEADRVEDAIHHVEQQLRGSGEREVSSRQVGDWVMEELRALDQVAYVRFASIYRSFEDVNAFREEIDRLEQTPSPELKKHQLDLPMGNKK
ncbi:transcriptional regulator NrdR [Solemya pervernicosa gill symbiont]|uniref:Transcriptional repressor NrdR n=2 Tax=Gammaproteobacteria incertae sedis TaxID=118884 RepID=A0A1T2L1J6_9GAMM|nr:transcriptional regulator NrdR [Candidatus Reidiella endopervernicosa]OOZ38816.1 transcriptional regulator NrdR [Solemya pervernicosa gill symbiont]QKQ27437.1 transcriptional regulator NrdR [Candidatus Reidiella endopervernicosa]